MDKNYQIMKYYLITVPCAIELKMHNVHIGVLGGFLLLICIILHMNSSEILSSGYFKVTISF